MATLSEPLKALILQRLASLEQIEIVLLLRDDPSRSWTAPEVAAEVRSAPESAAMRLFLLASSGMIAFEAAAVPRYRYVQNDAGTEELLRELAEVFRSDRPSVAELVGAPAADPIRSFADAFKLKK